MDDILMSKKVLGFEDIIFINPHAQFIRYDFENNKVEWADAFNALPLMPQAVELFGRCCYKSEDRITLESADKFVKMIIKSGHESVLEHANITVKYVGSRAMSHQLVRHRIAAYSQESQRYCNYGKTDKLFAIVPPSILNHEDKDVLNKYVNSVQNSYEFYKRSVAKKVNPEDARHLLPNAAKTEVVTTFNVRQWRHVIKHRGLNPKAQWEIRGITLQVLDEFARELPEFFGDLLQK